MPIEVEVPGVGTIEFPDGTPESVMQEKVRELLAARPQQQRSKPIGDMTPKEYKAHLAADEAKRRPEMVRQVRAKIRDAFRAGDFEGGVLAGLAHTAYVPMEETRKAEAQWREWWKKSGKTPPKPQAQIQHERDMARVDAEMEHMRRNPPPGAYPGLPPERL